MRRARWGDEMMGGGGGGGGGEEGGGGGGDEMAMMGDRLALAFVVGMRGHHIFLLRHIMTAEKRVMAVAVVMAMA